MANHYIRNLASGSANGADWTNAYLNPPATLVRGDQYYIADGFYAPYVYNSVAGSTPITIKYATPSDYGTVTGWDNSFSVASASFTGRTSDIIWDLRLSNLVIDGTIDSGILTPSTGRRGIKVESTINNGDGSYLIYNTNGTVCSNLTLKNVEMKSFYGSGIGHGAVFFNNFALDARTTGVLFQYCFFNGASQTWIKTNGTVAVTGEYCYFKNCGSNNASYHSAGLILGANQVASKLNHTYRYNVFENILYTLGSSTYIEPGSAEGVTDIDIYGNVFWASSPLEYSPLGIVAVTSSDKCTGMRFYNNTCIGMHGSTNGLWGGNTPSVQGVNWTGANNLFQGCVVNPTYSGIANFNNIDNNQVVQFVNSGAGNFHLITSTSGGFILPSPYNRDMDGLTRGRGVWGIGAFEYISSFLTRMGRRPKFRVYHSL